MNERTDSEYQDMKKWRKDHPISNLLGYPLQVVVPILALHWAAPIVTGAAAEAGVCRGPWHPGWGLLWAAWVFAWAARRYWIGIRP